MTVYDIKGMRSSFIEELDKRKPFIDLDMFFQRSVEGKAELKQTPAFPETVLNIQSAEQLNLNKTESEGRGRQQMSFIEQEDMELIVSEEVIRLVEDEEKPARDSKGIRWVKCTSCGEIKPDYEFVIYGGKGSVNRGTCRVCRRKEKEADH